MAERSVSFLLVGGGLASAACARQLREEGAEGEIRSAGGEIIEPRLHRGREA